MAIGIKTYDLFQRYSIIIIDKDTENALVKVEQYNFDNPNTRRNKISYKIDNPDFYESSWIEYNELFEKSKDYVSFGPVSEDILKNTVYLKVYTLTGIVFIKLQDKRILMSN